MALAARLLGGSGARGHLLRARALLPTGGGLPEDVWRRRHTGILVVLWAHVPVIVLFALARGEHLGHGLLEASVVAAAGAAAIHLRHQRAHSTMAASLGLFTCSAVLVHLSGGVIEVHFHFFVMVGLVVLYQEWLPFLAVIGYVVLHHGVGSAVDPSSVFNHPAAINNPWRWAFIHGLFILGMSAAGIAAWRLNEALRRDAVEGEQKLAEAQEVANLGSWEWDVPTGRLRWSDTQYRLFGIEPGTEVTYADILRGVHEEDRTWVDVALRRSALTGEPFAFDFRVRPGADGPVWLHARGAMVEHGTGAGGRLCGTTHDVTDRKASEEVIRRNEERYRQIIETAQEGVWMFDADQRTTFVNARMAAMLGCSPEEMVGTRLVDFMDDEAGRIASEQLARSSAGLNEQHDLELRRPDGTSVWALVSTSEFDDEGSTGLLAMVSDITDRKRAESELAHRALHDDLTGLPNRALLLDRLEHALARAGQSGTSVAVLFMDLDRFKLVNDSLGHGTGDALLEAVAHRLRGALNRTDTIARFGGDEFVLLCEDVVDEAKVAALAQRLLALLADPFVVEDQVFHVSASVGISLGRTESSSAALVRDADAAMYRAKERGRGSYEIFNDGTRRAAVRRLHVENGLRTALERGELRLHYQPIVAVDGGRVVGAEALLRWEHPERGLMLPDSFIPVAEESGLIVPMGAWVLQEACRQAAAWQEELRRDDPLEISVNLSARQLLHADLIGSVAEAMEAAAVDASNVSLCIEVTESIVMQDPDASAATLERLRALGVRIGMDDFGTGYSSLAYLRHFPFDLIKIDRQFVSPLTGGPDERAIVRAIVQLAGALGLTAVAEGVETPEQLRELRGIGCELAQGFLFARPRPADELLPLLRTTSLQPA